MWTSIYQLDINTDHKDDWLICQNQLWQDQEITLSYSTSGAFRLFGLILYIPVNKCSVMSGWVFLGWTSSKQRIKCLAQRHNTVTLPEGGGSSIPNLVNYQVSHCALLHIWKWFAVGIQWRCLILTTHNLYFRDKESKTNVTWIYTSHLSCLWLMHIFNEPPPPPPHTHTHRALNLVYQ